MELIAGLLEKSGRLAFTHTHTHAHRRITNSHALSTTVVPSCTMDAPSCCFMLCCFLFLARILWRVCEPGTYLLGRGKTGSRIRVRFVGVRGTVGMFLTNLRNKFFYFKLLLASLSTMLCILLQRDVDLR